MEQDKIQLNVFNGQDVFNLELLTSKAIADDVAPIHELVISSLTRLKSSCLHKYTQEVVRQCWIAVPMICVNLMQYFVTVLSVMFVGHLGELELARASIATSLASVLGYYVLVLPIPSSHGLL